MEWSNEETLLFLELYHSEPVLWDPSHEIHKDKTFVSDAWNRIRENQLFNHRPLLELKKKKDSLVASFRTHLRKKKHQLDRELRSKMYTNQSHPPPQEEASIRSGAGAEDVYKPVWFAYEYMENFLAQIYDVHRSINTQNQEFSCEDPLPDVQDIRETLEDQEAFMNVEQSTEVLDLQSIPVTPARPTQRKPAPATAGSSSQSTIRRRANPPELVEDGKQMQQAFVMLQNLTSRKPLEEYECDLYRKMIAQKLGKIPGVERDIVMYELDGFLLERTRKRPRSASVIEHPGNSLNVNPHQTMTRAHVYTSLQSSRTSSIDRASPHASINSPAARFQGENSSNTNSFIESMSNDSVKNVQQSSNSISQALSMTVPSYTKSDY